MNRSLTSVPRTALLGAFSVLCGCATTARIEVPFTTVTDRLQAEGKETALFGDPPWTILSRKRDDYSLGMDLSSLLFLKPGEETKKARMLFLRGELEFVPDGASATTMSVKVRELLLPAPAWLRSVDPFSIRRQTIENGMAQEARLHFERMSHVER